jgi:protein phosphatase PTC7
MITISVNSLATHAIKSSLTTAAGGGARRPQWISIVTTISSTSHLQSRQYRIAQPAFGSITPRPETGETCLSKIPFRFETGYALRPKRPSRPFPPPFVSIPSSSFSDPLTTHSQSQDRRPSVGGELIRGLTNGDDAVVAAENFIGVNDGVGAWAMKSQGHAA